jgi:hypothetical protein
MAIVFGEKQTKDNLYRSAGRRTKLKIFAEKRRLTPQQFWDTLRSMVPDKDKMGGTSL